MPLDISAALPAQGRRLCEPAFSNRHGAFDSSYCFLRYFLELP
jgi:hypothetical protein